MTSPRPSLDVESVMPYINMLWPLGSALIGSGLVKLLHMIHNSYIDQMHGPLDMCENCK